MKSLALVLIALVLMISLVASWYSYQTEEINAPFNAIDTRLNLVRDLKERFPKNEVKIQETLQEDFGFYSRQHLKISSNFIDTIDAVWWKKKSGDHQKILIILPIAGSHDPGHILARYFLLANGYDILQVLGGSTKRFLDDRDLKLYSTAMGIKGVVNDVSYFMQLRVVSYVETVGWLKKKGYADVNLLGVSLGAIEGSLLALDPSIKASVLVMGGADMAEIIMHSKEPFVARWREELCRQIKASSGKEPAYDEILKMLQECLGFDPLKYAGAADPHKVLLIIAKGDETIPVRNAVKLWLSLNQPRLIIFPTTHRGMAFYTPAVLYHAGQFFKRD